MSRAGRWKYLDLLEGWFRATESIHLWRPLTLGLPVMWFSNFHYIKQFCFCICKKYPNQYTLLLVSHPSPHTPISYLFLSAPHFGLHHLGSSPMLLLVRYSQWEAPVRYGRTEETIGAFLQYFHQLKSCLFVGSCASPWPQLLEEELSLLAPVTLSALVFQLWCSNSFSLLPSSGCPNISFSILSVCSYLPANGLSLKCLHLTYLQGILFSSRTLTNVICLQFHFLALFVRSYKILQSQTINKPMQGINWGLVRNLKSFSCLLFDFGGVWDWKNFYENSLGGVVIINSDIFKQRDVDWFW